MEEARDEGEGEREEGDGEEGREGERGFEDWHFARDEKSKNRAKCSPKHKRGMSKGLSMYALCVSAETFPFISLHR